MNPEEYYSVKDAAKKAGISYMALHQRIHRGSVEVVRVSDRIILIHKDELEKLSGSRKYKQKNPHYRHPLWKTYYNMIQRCYVEKHKQYRYYGGRGISVCKRWRDSFELFAQDMGPKPETNYSINRKDNNGNYTPKNCSWATPKEQANNQRRRRA